MARPVHRTIARASRKVPGVRHLPVLQLLAIAEVILLARRHIVRLEPHERRRLLVLVRQARGRRGKLTPREQDELSTLVAKTGPRELLGEAVRLSPVPFPGLVSRRVKRS